MRALPRIPTTSQLRALEADWIKKCDQSWGQVLMEIAGRAAAEAAHEMWSQERGTVAIVCGRGNNGGDGLVIARYLVLWKVPVKVFIVDKSGSGAVDMNTEEARANLRIAQNLGVLVRPAPSDFSSAIGDCSLLIDAMLGTGLDRELEGAYKDIVECMNRSKLRILAVDVPSGINSDTGQVMGVAIDAERTVTFGYLKPGLLQYPGAAHAGAISCVDIGLPELIGSSDQIYMTTGDYVRGCLPIRKDDSHKGTYGSVLMIGGSAGMFGAAGLAGHTALRTGAGLVTIAAPKSVVQHLPAAEIIYKILPETDAGSIASDAVAPLIEEIDKAASLVIGPGISQHPDTVKFVHQLLPIIAEKKKPCVIDADALNAISQNPASFPVADSSSFVMTPHPKELSRLMSSSVGEIQRDRISSVRKASTRYGCNVVLKGARTVISKPSGTVYINTTGNSGMATAGSGDVLSGIIGGLMAQGVQPFEATVIGAYLHGTAGDCAAVELQNHTGIIAGDISDAVPIALSNILQGMVSRLERELTSHQKQIEWQI